MNFPRREFLRLATAAVAFASWARPYPSWPARLVGGGLSGRRRNKTGAGSNIAIKAVVRSPADGHTMLLASAANAINATLYDKLNFNYIRDIAPASGIGRVSNLMVVNPSFPAKTVPEFIAYAKANPGKIAMASAGIGSPQHVGGELFKIMTGVNMVHVPYRGGVTSAPQRYDMGPFHDEIVSFAPAYVPREGLLRGTVCTAGSYRQPA